MSNSVQKGSEVWKQIEPFAMRALGRLLSSSKSGGSSTEGYAIILYRSSSQKKSYYSATEAGLSAAIAAASSGDIIVLPAETYSGNHTVPDGVSLVGLDRNRCVLTGQINLGLNCLLGEVSVTRSGSSGTVIGVILDNSGARIVGCLISVSNSGGDAIGVKATPGAVGYADGCTVTVTASGDGWGYYADGSDITVESGSVEAAIPMEAV